MIEQSIQQSGVSTDSEEHNVVEFMVPEDVSGIVNLKLFTI